MRFSAACMPSAFLSSEEDVLSSRAFSASREDWKEREEALRAAASVRREEVKSACVVEEASRI